MLDLLSNAEVIIHLILINFNFSVVFILVVHYNVVIMLLIEGK